MHYNKIRVAILDDGICPEVCPLVGNFRVGDDLAVSIIEEGEISPYSHGSMCARIIQQYVELEGVDVFSIQILQEDNLRGNIERLLKAFEMCISMDIRLIHLSVGTYAFEDFAKLEEAVCYLLNADRFLIAATGNRGTVTYPAYLPGVMGVKYHPELTDDEYVYYYDSFMRIHLQASSKHKLILEGQDTETPITNSYAAPLITAKVLSYLKVDANLDKKEIWRLLIENARNPASYQSSEPCLYPPVEIPVVLLSGFSAGRLSHLMELMMGCLRREEYHARAASNLLGSRPWDETPIPENCIQDEAILPEPVNLDLFIARMAWYFSCEIILLGITFYISPDRYRNISLWIYGDKSNEIQTASATDDGQVLQAIGIPDDEVYGRMIEMLT